MPALIFDIETAGRAGRAGKMLDSIASLQNDAKREIA